MGTCHPDSRRHRIVITGIGLITPLGPDRESTWQAIRSGRSAVRMLPESLTGAADYAGAPAVADGLPNLSIAHCPLPAARCLPPTTRCPLPALEEPAVAMALAATQAAVADARLELAHADRSRVGCVIGSSKGGMRSFARAYAGFSQTDEVCPHCWMSFLPCGAASAVASAFDLRGPVLCPVAACATGLVAVMRAADLLRDGYCAAVLAGSADASLTPALLAAFRRMGVLARGFDDPAEACRPFDARRSGFVVGEGAAVFVLEQWKTAAQRGAPVYGELLAAVSAAEAYDLARLSGSPEVLANVLTRLLRKAGLAPDDVSYINAHGTATRQNDVQETQSLKLALGRPYRVPISATKSMIGHLLGAAGSVELAVTLLALRDGFVPATLNLTDPDPQCDLDYTPLVGRKKRLETALKVSLGFGGHVAALALRK